METRRLSCSTLIAGLTALLLAVAFTPVSAEDNGTRQQGEGKYAQLTALWWQWESAQPAVDVNGTNTNPVLDSTGEYAAVGQEDGIGPGDKFFFLAGTFGGDVTRTATVPSGKALFFPVLALEVDNAADPPTAFSVPELRARAKAVIDSATSLYATLDGTDLEIFRARSPVFAYTVPDENSIYDYFGLFGPQFEGTIKPAVADGYWVFRAPLPSGEYTLKFGSTAPGFSLNVTYYLTVQ
jgi:hypothetical protein